MQVRDGTTITGYDFGRKRNHIVGCRIMVDTDHPKGFRITHWLAIDFGKSKLTDAVDVLARSDSPLFHSDWHVLERQVAQAGRYASNVFCYSLSHALQCKLVMTDLSSRVLFMTSAKKFAEMQRPARAMSYRKRKQWAVDICVEKIAEQDEDVCLPFMKMMKRDDFADAFLYAYVHMQKHRSMDE